ncbi:MAG: DinB family protein [Candidatus Planktophila sp.]
MTLTLERALKHMSWANQEVYKLIIALPDEALDAYATDPEWNVGEILRHIASSAGGYGARLKGVDAEVLVRPTTMQELQVIAKKLLSSDSELLHLANVEDEKIAVTREGRTIHWMRSTIVTQAIHHATEHRAQAVSALEAKGFKAVDLDDYDLWAYEIKNG